MIRLRKSLRVATLLALLAAISAFLIAGCEDKNGQISGAVDSELSLRTIAEDIAVGVGTVLEVSTDGDCSPVFVFQEKHNSPLQQAELAVMLNRLYAEHGLRRVGLEGACVERFVQPRWLQSDYDPEDPIGPREDVFVQLLANGEISGVEVMGLIYPNVIIEPIETAVMYEFDRSSLPEATLGLLNYMYTIAQLGLSDEDRREFLRLHGQEEKDAAFEFAFEHTEHGALLSSVVSPSGIGSLNVLERRDLFRRISDVASRYDQDCFETTASDFLKHVEYSDAAYARGIHMAQCMTVLAEAGTEALLAVSCGGGHAEIPIALKEQGVPYVVIRNLSYDWEEDPTRLTDEEYDRKNEALPIEGGSSLGGLLCGGWKYPPVLGEVWAESMAELFLVTDCIARAVAAGTVPPYSDAIFEDLPAPNYVKVLPDTVREDYGEAVFSAEVERSDGTSVQLWVRARCDQATAEMVLEQKLLDAIEEMKSVDSVPESRGLIAVSSQTVADVGLDLESVSEPIKI